MSNYDVIDNAKKKDVENDSGPMNDQELPEAAGGNDAVGGFWCGFCGLYFESRDQYLTHLTFHCR